MHFTGKTVLITGSGGGQGAAEARLFAQHKANVIVADLKDDDGATLVAEIRKAGGSAEYRHLDVTSEADWQSAIRFAHERFKGLHVLVNNAGVSLRGKNIGATTREDWDRVIGVNLKGMFLGLRHVLPVMIAQKKGAVVNTASVAGTVGSPNGAAYSASKHGVIGLTRSAAGEVGKLGVRVNAICPGPINTRMIHALEAMANPADPGAVARFNVGRNPMGRYGEPEEVARVVLFLCSDASDYVNGAAWIIDGGRAAI